MNISRPYWCVFSSSRQERLRGFFKGLSPYLLHVTPNICIVFLMYEKMTHMVEARRQRDIGDEEEDVAMEGLKKLPKKKAAPEVHIDLKRTIDVADASVACVVASSSKSSSVAANISSSSGSSSNCSSNSPTSAKDGSEINTSISSASRTNDLTSEK